MSSPQPAKLAPGSASPGSGGRKVLLLITALFALPILVATGLFASGWRPAETGRPHGELLADASQAPLSFEALRSPDGQALPAGQLAGHWLLVVAGPGPCETACQAKLAAVRQIHIALGKQMPRVRRLWLSPAPATDPQLPDLRAYGDLVIATPGADRRWQALIPAAGIRFLILDPAGRAVLGYREPFDPRGALHDLERLLKYSWIG